MITRVSTVCVFVQDQDRAKDFYTNRLGFELVTDQPLWPGAPTRWVSVKPTGSSTEVILYLPDENWEHYKQTVGQSQAVTFDVQDITGTVADLKARGVTVVGDVDVQPWGSSVFIQDSEGNRLLLVEQPKP
jgi:catechol 2,3-dioxygenase-like lactoylglutathione lyase family enzyme